MDKKLDVWFAVVAFLIIVLGSIGGIVPGLILLLLSFVYPPFSKDFVGEVRGTTPQKRFLPVVTFFFVLWAVLATLAAAPGSGVAWGTVLGLVVVAFPVFYAGVYAHNLDSRLVWRFFIWGAALAVAYIFYDHYVAGHRRAELLVGCNAAATLLLGSLGVFLAAFYREKSNYKWLYIAAVLLNVVGIIFTGSRAAWIGTILIFGVLFWFRAKNKQIIAVVLLGVLVLGAALFTNSYWKRRFLTIFDFNINSDRINAYAVSLSMMKDNFFGVGLGNFQEAHARYLTEEDDKEPLAHAHNIFLNFGAELGPVAFVLSVLIYGSALYMCYKIAKVKSHFLPVGAAMLAVVVRELFDATTSGLAVAGFLWFIFGLIFAEFLKLEKSNQDARA